MTSDLFVGLLVLNVLLLRVFLPRGWWVIYHTVPEWNPSCKRLSQTLRKRVNTSTSVVKERVFLLFITWLYAGDWLITLDPSSCPGLCLFFTLPSLFFCSWGWWMLWSIFCFLFGRKWWPVEATVSVLFCAEMHWWMMSSDGAVSWWAHHRARCRACQSGSIWCFL